MTRAFLSHSSADNALARKIYRELKDQVISVWFDRIELRPGDSLLGKITGGINQADILLVLITENSKASNWVQFEIETALNREKSGQDIRLIPLLLKGTTLPNVLTDKIWVGVDETGNGIQEIIPALFRESYILDISLREDNLELDLQSLGEGLHEYYRSEFESIQVRINNQQFDKKVLEIVQKTISKPGIPSGMVMQIQQIMDSADIRLPIYWTNLAQLVAELATEVFSYYGKNLDAHRVAIKALENAFKFAQHVMCAYLGWAVFAVYAEEFNHPEIAAYMRRYENLDDEKMAFEISRDVRALTGRDDLIPVGLAGSEAGKVADAKLYLPGVTEEDRSLLQATTEVSDVVMSYTWYTTCVPQIVGRSLRWTSFREGKPLHELAYKVGLKMDDYDLIGLQ